MIEKLINVDALGKELEPRIREVAKTVHSDEGNADIKSGDLDAACEAHGMYLVGDDHHYKTIQSAVDAAPEESSVGTEHVYGDSAWEDSAKVLITNSYDAGTCDEVFPIKIEKKQVDVIGFARGGARIVGERDKPIFEVTGVGSYDYRNCRKFENLRTHYGDPVIKVDSDNGLIVRDVVMQGPTRGIEVWEGSDDHLDSVMNRFENVHIWWPHDDAITLRAKSASNATHIQGCWIHGAGGGGSGIGIRIHGAACTISQSVIEQVGGRAIEAKGCTALGMYGNYLEANYENATGYPLDVQLNGVYGFTAMFNYFNGAGGVMRGVNAYDVEAPVFIGNVFNNYANSERNGTQGHAVGLHGKAPGACFLGNVSLLDKGGKERCRIVGMDHTDTSWTKNNIGKDGLEGNHDTRPGTDADRTSDAGK